MHPLKDCLAEWRNRILFPTLAGKASSEETVDFEKRKAVSVFFGGSPQSGTKATTQFALPKLNMPSASTTPSRAPMKKKQEGC
ncbi:MAG: hypothetical protein C4326_03705 [Ignavibacteria bacterium]